MPHSPLENLRIWTEGMALAKAIYQLTRNFPKEEIYGLTSQMRRCAISILSNIAEGSQRGTDADFANFLVIARGSWGELKTQIILAKELSYISEDSEQKLLEMMQNLGKQLGAFHKALTAKRARG